MTKFIRCSIFSLRWSTPAVLLLALLGCATTHAGPQFDPAKLAQIRNGTSTIADVVTLFGEPPSLVTQYDGRKVANYTASDSVHSELPLMDKGGEVVYVGNPPPGIQQGERIPMGFVHEIETLEVDYTAAGIVEGYRLSACDANGACKPLDAGR